MHDGSADAHHAATVSLSADLGSFHDGLDLGIGLHLADLVDAHVGLDLGHDSVGRRVAKSRRLMEPSGSRPAQLHI
jgi:hypothetical protein